MSDQHAAKQCAGCRFFIQQVAIPHAKIAKLKVLLGDCSNPVNDAKTWSAPHGFERQGTDHCKHWEPK